MPTKLCVIFGLCLLTCSASAEEKTSERVVDFNREVRPILSDTCFLCHGPDASQRQAKLRLDTKAGLLADAHAVVPGKPSESPLFQRITSTDPDEKMPPADSGRTLSKAQVETLRLWIAQGAKWEKHWAFVPPTRPNAPTVQNNKWVRNPIDRFVLSRLEQEGLTPADEASKPTLIRRVTLDLTGLPPTIEEIDAFLADGSADAYERLVDRLLASPRYGERMARPWLDAARYADTNGYQSDGEREMWRWRDWVINALNLNMPYDQFTIEQLAGDLLPNPSLDQLIATGFNRNHRGNGEGGIIAEEYAVEYVADRVDTSATVWLGLTMGCARCHDHKYDPLSQNDFYQFFAFFNNIEESGKALKYGNSPPLIPSPTPKQQQHQKVLESKIATLDEYFDDEQEDLQSYQELMRTLQKLIEDQEKLAEQKNPKLKPKQDWTWAKKLEAMFTFDGHLKMTDEFLQEKTDHLQAQGGEPVYELAKIDEGIRFDGGQSLEAEWLGAFGFYDRFTLAAWVKPEKRDGFLLSRMVENDRGTGYQVRLADGRIQVNLVKRWLDDAIRVETKSSIPLRQWSHITVTYDGSRWASGIRVYLDGKLQPLTVNLDELNQSFDSDGPFRVGSGPDQFDRFFGVIDDVRVYHDDLTPREVMIVSAARPVHELTTLKPAQRTPAEEAKYQEHFMRHQAPDRLQQRYKERYDLQEQLKEHVAGYPTTMIMKERREPRTTHLLKRGRYDQPGEVVTPGVPQSLSRLPTDAPTNRLGLAKWIVSPDHPLTSRVAVNRTWQLYFGTGLVKTTEDFGTQGERPSHPELLDWLATEFVRTGWDQKALHRLIVTSATYRQSAAVTPELLGRDPDNRLLARGPRLRLSAQMLRDQAFAVSGLLVEHIGGPSVKTRQPEGLWEELTNDVYKQGTGDDLHRRSVYTFWKRTISPPLMATFDAAGRETCVVRVNHTNTALQSLAQLNSADFREATEGLGRRMFHHHQGDIRQNLLYGFKLVTAHLPTEGELAILVQAWTTQHEDFRKNPKAAEELLGETIYQEVTRFEELAAYVMIAELLLNLDETTMRE